eukprot:6761398-Heterocapsa_arctica.AAC.1
MLVGVMKPKRSRRLPDFADELRAWELAVQRYEDATCFPMPDDVKFLGRLDARAARDSVVSSGKRHWPLGQLLDVAQGDLSLPYSRPRLRE